MISEQLVDLSRLQFAVTALYHFLFVPLTICLGWLLVIMESVYVMIGNVVWKDMADVRGLVPGNPLVQSPTARHCPNPDKSFYTLLLNPYVVEAFFSELY